MAAPKPEKRSTSGGTRARQPSGIAQSARGEPAPVGRQVDDGDLARDAGGESAACGSGAPGSRKTITSTA